MNSKELEENLNKTFRTLEVSALILENVYDLAEKLVDEKMAYAGLIEKASLQRHRADLMINREEAVLDQCQYTCNFRRRESLSYSVEKLKYVECTDSVYHTKFVGLHFCKFSEVQMDSRASRWCEFFIGKWQKGI